MTREKRLLALSCPPARKHQRYSHWSDFREDWCGGLLKEIYREVANIAKIGQKYRGFDMQIWRRALLLLATVCRTKSDIFE